MSKTADGGPAFPCAEDHRIAADFPWTAGMTLRDWFAGQALAGMHACLINAEQWPTASGHRGMAEQAYAAADAMLAARKDPRA